MITTITEKLHKEADEELRAKLLRDLPNPQGAYPAYAKIRGPQDSGVMADITVEATSLMEYVRHAVFEKLKDSHRAAKVQAFMDLVKDTAARQEQIEQVVGSLGQ